MPEALWRDQYYIRSYETDLNGRATLQTICNYMQETAGNHAIHLGVSMGQALGAHQTWVLSRIRVKVERFPAWRDEVLLETWPSGENGLAATREFLLYAADGEVLARASSLWLVVDLQRRRPVRIPSAVSALELPRRNAPLPAAPDRISIPEQTEVERSFEVRHSDIDMNRHVNNVRYIEWACESVPPSTRDRLTPCEIDIQYRTETTFGETVLVRSARLAENGEGWAHVLTRTSDGREVARARSQWTEVPRN